MKKLYIVISSWDNYSDHYKVNECVCDSLFIAENKKTELENKYREEIPFPFNWVNEGDFWILLQEDRTTMEDKEIFYQWRDYKNKLETFNCCFISEIDYYGDL